MATSRALGLRTAQPGLRAGLLSFRATETSRSRVQVRGGGGDTHADPTARAALRDLSRDLERNAEGYQILIHGSARLMGAPHPRPLVGDQAWRERAVAAFRARASRTRGGFDVRGLLSWPALCALWWRALWRDGDVAVLPLQDGTLATIEADLIAGGRSKNQNRRVVGGVELDGNSRVRGYWICPRTTWGNPDEPKAEFYPAEATCFLPHLWSASSTRGVPLISAGLDNQERVDALVEAEVISAEQASAIYGAMERDAVSGQYAPAVPLADAATAPATSYSTNGANPSQVEWSAGSFFDLPAGVKWKPHSPARPNLNVVEMMRQILRQSCAHIGIPFHVLYADFLGVNWSGNRGLVQLTRDALAWWRTTLCEPFLAPLWSWWLRPEIDSGRLPWPEENGQRVDPARLYDVAWDWPDPEWPDPSREAQALDSRLAQGASSLTREIGPDWPLIQDERQRELLRADDLHITRCAQAHAVTKRSGVPGLTWREVINRDVAPNTVTTIPTPPVADAADSQTQSAAEPDPSTVPPTA